MNAKLTMSCDADDEPARLNFSIGKIIRQLRRERSMSGEDLGALSGYSQQQISRYERGDCCFTLVVLMRLSCALGISVWDLLDKVRVFYITGDKNYYPPDKWGSVL